MKRFTIALLLALGASTLHAAEVSDPTRPPSAAEIRAWFGDGNDAASAQPRWELQSVLIAEDRRIAVINGERVREGERIDQAEVVAIQAGEVTLRHDGSEVNLTIASQIAPGQYLSRD